MQSNVKANTVVTHRMVSDSVIGFTVIGYPERTLDLSKVHDDNRDYAEYHGWAQRIPDKAAINRADKAGVVRTRVEMNRLKDAAIGRVIEHYESGTADWSMKAISGARESVDHSLTVQAICDVQGISHDVAMKWIAETATRLNISKSATMDALAINPKFAERVAELREARVADVDPEELLVDLPISE